MSDYGEKTRARIKDALEALVEEGSGKKPTVSEVLSRSGVARSTFYVYYENFQDLLEELAADYSAQIIRYSADACTSYVYSILRLWAKNGFDKTPEELGDVLTESIAIATDLFGER